MLTAAMGPDHRVTLLVRNHLANCRGRSGEFDAAVTELEELGRDQTRVLGVDDPDTVTTRYDIADRRGHMGQLVRTVADWTARHRLRPHPRRTIGTLRRQIDTPRCLPRNPM
ncbi:hypothetical protein ACQPXH_17800 [Nocardia sp. CA-135953]|uniref:hypothetical protein n=1 Tax=Nocardia sp. CA-135953 TaxID=3239978 RepID=UPI003D969B1C